MPRLHSKQAFSLVELAIVLVILGLLAGGVLSGQSLIRAAELRSVTTEYQRYYGAVQAFRDKYFALPGDMANATSFWGTDADGCPTHTNRVAKKETCNGNGDGLLAQDSNESFRAWQQLANAGLIEGSYSGVAGSLSAVDYNFGINSPKSKLKDAGWGYLSFDNVAAGNNYYFQYNYRNAFQLGNRADGVYPDGLVMKTEEAWNIDTKMDDGKPGTGRVIVFQPGGCSLATGIADYNKDYKLTETGSNMCGLWFVEDASR